MCIRNEVEMMKGMEDGKEVDRLKETPKERRKLIVKVILRKGHYNGD